MNILCVGHIAYDTTYIINDDLLEDKKIKAQDKIEEVGGRGYNYAYILNKLGLTPYIAGVIGNDYIGNKIKEKIKETNINTKYLKIDDIKTSSSVIISNIKTSSRTIITNKNTGNIDDIDINDKFDLILLDGSEYNTSIKVIENNKDAIIILDAEKKSDEILDLCHKVDYIICSKDFACDVTNMEFNLNDLEKICKKLENIFDKNIIITLGKYGSIYKNKDKIILKPTIEVNSIDTTSSGDIYHAVFAYGLIKKWNIDKIIRISNELASYSTTKLGKDNKIPSKEEIREIINDFEWSDDDNLT